MAAASALRTPTTPTDATLPIAPLLPPVADAEAEAELLRGKKCVNNMTAPVVRTAYVALPEAEADLETEEVLPAELAVPLVAAPEVAPVEVAGAVAVAEVAAAVSVELPLAAEVPVDSPVKQLLSAVEKMSVGSRLSAELGTYGRSEW